MKADSECEDWGETVEGGVYVSEHGAGVSRGEDVGFEGPIEGVEGPSPPPVGKRTKDVAGKPSALADVGTG